jgi:DNA-binding transcriptional LysR family regulator
MMNLRQIEIFRAIMHTGSVTDAARLLHVTQPGISRAARHLELQLGVRLFERGGRRLVPTADAVALFGEVEKMYRGVQTVAEFARGLRRGEHVRLRIVSSPSVGLQVVPTAIARLQRRLPGLRVRLEILPGTQLIDLLCSDQADVGVFALRADHPLLLTETIGSVALVCAFPRNHPLARRRSVAVGDVVGLPFISFGTETYQGRLVESLFAAAGITIDPIMQVRFGRTACAAVEAGSGVTFVDELTARSASAADLAWRPLRPAVRVDLGLARPRARGLGSTGAAFFEEVRAVAQLVGLGVGSTQHAQTLR